MRGRQWGQQYSCTSLPHDAFTTESGKRVHPPTSPTDASQMNPMLPAGHWLSRLGFCTQYAVPGMAYLHCTTITPGIWMPGCAELITHVHLSAGHVLPGGSKSHPSGLSQKQLQSPATQSGWQERSWPGPRSAFEIEQYDWYAAHVGPFPQGNGSPG